MIRLPYPESVAHPPEVERAPCQGLQRAAAAYPVPVIATDGPRSAKGMAGHDATTPPETLRRDLANRHLVPVEQDWQELHGGRVNRCWRVGDLVVKLFDPAGHSPLFPNEPAAEALMLRHLAGLDLAPTFRAAGDGWIAYGHVEGSMWREGADPSPVAAALCRLWDCAAPEGLRLLANGSAALCDQIASLSDRGARPEMPQAEVPPARPRLIHGDAVAGNIISGPSGVRLIDWQCPAIGDPTEDVAAFLSPAMRWIYGGTAPEPDLERQFLACIPEDIAGRYQSLKPLFHLRMMQHCRWRLRQGHADYGLALDLERAAFQNC